MFLFVLSELKTLCTQCPAPCVTPLYIFLFSCREKKALHSFPASIKTGFLSRRSPRHGSILQSLINVKGSSGSDFCARRNSGRQGSPASPPLLSLRGERGQVLKDLQLGLRGAWFTGSEQSRISPVLLWARTQIPCCVLRRGWWASPRLLWIEAYLHRRTNPALLMGEGTWDAAFDKCRTGHLENFLKEPKVQPHLELPVPFEIRSVLVWRSGSGHHFAWQH